MTTYTQNGWPVIAQTGTTRVYLGDDYDGATVRTGAVADAFAWLVEQLHARVERVTVVNGWRSVKTNDAAGGLRTSNHLSGTALDVNGHLHPYELTAPPDRRGSRYRSGFSASQVREVRAILEEAGGLFEWGQDFPAGARDPMHFAVARGKKITDVAAFVRRIKEADDVQLSDKIDLKGTRAGVLLGDSFDRISVEGALLRGVAASVEVSLIRAQVSGLVEAVKALAQSQGADPAMIARAAEKGAERALEDLRATLTLSVGD